MRKHLLIGSAIAMTMAPPALAAPWVRSYVISAYEPAFYWGGKLTFRKGNLIAPGTDCPSGNTPALNYAKAVKTPWRTDEDVRNALHPKGTNDLNVLYGLQERAISYRGFRKNIETYINPFAAPDPGQDEVVGKIAEGFNLDGNAKTGGFTSPDGVRGIDNAYYRAWGCMNSFRGIPYHAALSIRTTDKMLEGLFTIVVRLSGNKDPMNDDHVTMEVGYSPDHPVKGSDDHVVGGYSFRIVKAAEYTRMKATVKNGVYESEQVGELHMPKFGWFMQNQGDQDFHKGRLRLIVNKDGSASGLAGGYRDWREVYVENAFPQSGATQESREHENLIGMYYALRRNADGMADPRTGKNMGISIAYRFKAMPAFVIDPVTPASIYLPEISKPLIRKMQVMRAVFHKAVASRQIQPIPAGSSEGAPYIVQRADGTWGFRQEGYFGAPPAVKKPQPGGPASEKPTSEKKDMVRNGAPAKLASATPAR